ncbi:MAG: tetratricopeptide repeat protein [Anaerolineae bacterium]|nr:tetratricopeptide repeat protein [Anaerolineae bacterium]
MSTKELHEKLDRLLAAGRLEEVDKLLDGMRQQSQELTAGAQMWLHYYAARLAWARQNWRQAESGFRQLLDQDLPVDLRAQALRWLAESLHYGGQWQEQLILEQEALVLSSVLGDDSNRAAIYDLMGWAHLRQSRVQEALVAFEHSLRLCQGLGSREYESWALNNLGLAYLRMGDAAKALDAHRASLTIRREEGLHQEEGRSLHNIAEVLVHQGHWRQADKYLRDAEVIARELDDQIGLSYIMYTRGQWEKEQGRLEQALVAYRQSLALRTAVGSQVLIAEVQWAISDTHRLVGNWLKAAEHAEKAAEAWREVVRPWGARDQVTGAPGSATMTGAAAGGKEGTAAPERDTKGTNDNA